MSRKMRVLSIIMVLTMLATLAPWSSIKSSAAFTGALQFDANGKFTVMQVADIQTNTSVPARVVAAISNNINRYHPDLVVFTGDNIYEGISSVSNFQTAVNSFLSPLISTNTKFAVTFGNHDSDGSGGSLLSQYTYYGTKGGSLFIDQDVPALTGDASGVIPIYANGQTSGTPAFDVYVMDSGHSPSSGSYDGCYTNQVDYYIQRSQTYPDVPSLWFQHVIVPDINTRCMSTTNNGTGVSKGGLYIDNARINYTRSSSTSMADIYKEATCPPNTSVYESAAHRSSAAYGSKTLYEAWRDNGNLKGAYFGHDHLNEFTCTTSDGIDLGYGESTTLYKTLGIVNYNDGNPGVSIYELDISGTYTNEYSAETEIAKAMVSFDSNGGIGTMRNQLVAKSSSATLAVNSFTKTGYAFSGWNTAANGTGTSYVNGASINIGTTDITLYAKWMIVNQDQAAPTGLSGVAPTYYNDATGSITGTTSTMQWSTTSGGTYTTCGTSVNGLTPGTYFVRKTAYVGYNASPDTAVTVPVGLNRPQIAPTDLTGVTPTYYNDATGSITGTTTAMQWSTASGGTYTTCGTSVSNLTPGTYYVRYTSYAGYNASPDTSVAVPVGPNRPQSAPSDLFGVAPTYYGDSDGSITGTTTDMEWSMTSGGTYTAVTGTSVTGLAAGTYYVRYAATAGYDEGTYASVVVEDGPVHKVTITFNANGGTGSTGPVLMTVGDALSAPIVAWEGYIFTGWLPEVPEECPSADTLYVAQWKPPVTFETAAGSTTVIDGDLNFIYGLKPGITQTEFESSYIITPSSAKLVYTYVNGNFGTGTKVELVDKITNEIAQTYQIIIFGDYNGDGSIDSNDEGLIIDTVNYRYTALGTEQESAFFMAGDVYRDGVIDENDACIVLNSLNGFSPINQSPDTAP